MKFFMANSKKNTIQHVSRIFYARWCHQVLYLQFRLVTQVFIQNLFLLTEWHCVVFFTGCYFYINCLFHVSLYHWICKISFVKDLVNSWPCRRSKSFKKSLMTITQLTSTLTMVFGHGRTGKMPTKDLWSTTY